MNKPKGYEAIGKFLEENQINPDNFRLVFGANFHGSRTYPHRISFEYEHDTIFDWDTISWGDARVITYLYLAAVYYPQLVAAFDESQREGAQERYRASELEKELKVARERISSLEERLASVKLD